MGRTTNLEAQTKLAERLNAGDLDGAVAVFAPNAHDHDPAPDQPAGREGFKAFFTTVTQAFPDAHLEPANVVADDEHVCIAHTLSGTHKGEFHGIPATGRPVEVRGLQMARFADGQIVERWCSSDELGILTQLGAEVN